MPHSWRHAPSPLACIQLSHVTTYASHHYRNRLSCFSFFTALFSWKTNMNLQQDHCCSICNALMMITRSYLNVCNMSFVSFSLAVIFIIRLFSTSAFHVPRFWKVFKITKQHQFVGWHNQLAIGNHKNKK